MAESTANYSTPQKLAIFRRCFSGLAHVYGTYDQRTGRVRQVKEPVTDDVLLHHLQGRQPYGVYLLVGERTSAVVADFDAEDTSAPLEFQRRAADRGVAAYLERSKRKGWHAWIFFQALDVPAAKARSLVRTILRDMGRSGIEIFPKHDRLIDSTHYGNFINAPLFGRLVRRGRTVFVDPDDGLRPYANQWNLLDNVRHLDGSSLDQILAYDRSRCGEDPGNGRPPATKAAGAGRTFGLPSCAQHVLADGVTEHQRIVCFRLAVQLKKAGLPEDIAVASLVAWAAKNRPADDKRIITRSEVIAQTHCAYTGDYRGCGCEEPALQEFCDAGCPLRGAGQGSGAFVPRMDSSG